MLLDFRGEWLTFWPSSENHSTKALSPVRGHSIVNSLPETPETWCVVFSIFLGGSEERWKMVEKVRKTRLDERQSSICPPSKFVSFLSFFFFLCSFYLYRNCHKMLSASFEHALRWFKLTDFRHIYYMDEQHEAQVCMTWDFITGLATDTWPDFKTVGAIKWIEAVSTIGHAHC